VRLNLNHAQLNLLPSAVPVPNEVRNTYVDFWHREETANSGAKPL
jgi:hypothetical protein